MVCGLISKSSSLWMCVCKNSVTTMVGHKSSHFCFVADVLVVTHSNMPQKSNANLHKANKAKNDEFYTQYPDIQKEINAYLEYNPDVFRNKTILLPCDDPEWSNFTKFFAQNFENFWLKKLISTSFANESKNVKVENYQPTLFETQSPKFDKEKTNIKWKIFILDQDTNQNWKIDIDDLQRDYLEWDWDFRSDEIKKLRDEADIIITNPPFSLFREFLARIVEKNKKFIIIWNQNSITYKEVFSLIKNNKIWLWNWFNAWNAYFRIYGKSASDYASWVYDEKTWLVKFRNCCRFTNLDHGRRHQPLWLMTMSDNIKFSKHKEIKQVGYKKYDNYDAIEVPFTDAIPSDYEWIMWVPISFLDKYCPEQFEILGMESSAGYDKEIVWIPRLKDGDARPTINWKTTYARIFIRKK